MKNCPLCCSTTINDDFYQDDKRRYVQCLDCELVSVEDKYLLSSKAEKAQYDLHQNDPNDINYQTFLGRAFNPLLERISESSIGLDFGCGPGPAISVMAGKQGISVRNYDPYYYPDTHCLSNQYDFVTLTEVIEHVKDTEQLMLQLHQLLKKGASLVVMTKRLFDLEHFKNWHYKNDPTHIRFFSVNTFKIMSQRYDFKLEIIDDDVVILTKR